MKTLKAASLIFFLSFSTLSFTQTIEQTPTSQNEYKASMAWWQLLMQKGLCIYLMATYCTSDHIIGQTNPICEDCMRCLKDAHRCKQL